MRTLLLFAAMVVIGQQCYAQTDSIQIKLEQTKKLFENGAITDNEYVQMRAKILGIEPPKNEEYSLGKLYERSKSEITGGSILLGIGLSSGIGALVYDAYAPIPSSSNRNYSALSRQRKTATIGLGATGIIMTVTGAIVLGIGINDRVKYNSKKGNLAINFSGNELGLTYTF